MKMVARRTGLSPHLIRIWERRYQAVTPTRSGTNRRLYSEAEVARLTLLQQATHAGHSIGHVAHLTEAQLHELLDKDRQNNGAPTPIATALPDAVQTQIAEGLAAVQRLDAQALETQLSRAVSQLGQIGLVQQVLVPLIQQIGEAWQQGALNIAHEHVASAVIRSFLGCFARGYALPDTAPRLLVTTPSGQLHELGALMAAVVAGSQGWRVTYLGPSLPAEEIAGAASQGRARAVALSLVYPEDDPYLESELTRLRQLLPGEVIVLAGGRAAPSYSVVLDKIGAIQIGNLCALQGKLDEIRRARRP